eukprot:CAMPEP_0172214092 /NCGR_PEP_ID=MMETSP1050-20130122/37968_1 /TAXON_ID=233186 /ORGANISM="Cryptomonas curvata, Strain CCAP979/52" /LENGTH=769 /DNA_ID=CAMNT_0012895021 /DNA_START=580 /DNA_END=2888 /DNA_ORIENTATION=-
MDPSDLTPVSTRAATAASASAGAYGPLPAAGARAAPATPAASASLHRPQDDGATQADPSPIATALSMSGADPTASPSATAPAPSNRARGRPPAAAAARQIPARRAAHQRIAPAPRGRPPGRGTPTQRPTNTGWDRMDQSDEDEEDLGLQLLGGIPDFPAVPASPDTSTDLTMANPAAAPQLQRPAADPERAVLTNLADGPGDWTQLGSLRALPTRPRGGPLALAPHHPPAPPPSLAAPRAPPAFRAAPPHTASSGYLFAAGTMGLFRAQHEDTGPTFTHIRPRTLEERNAISEAAIAYMFCTLRQAEVTRPRTAAEDAAAIAAIKAAKYMTASGLPPSSLDRDMHNISFGPQAFFRGGLSPFEIGRLFRSAVPFMINDPNDVTTTAPWKALRTSAAELYARLEAEIAACRMTGTEHPMSSTIFHLIRKLTFAFFDLRAQLMLPLMALAQHELHAAAIHAIAGGYIDQAVMLRKCVETADDMIDSGIFSSRSSNPALGENAARVAMARPFLLALLHGMERDKNTAQMIQEYSDFVPPVDTLNATRLTALLSNSATGAALSNSFLRVTASPPPAPPRISPPVARLALPPPPALLPTATTTFNRGTPAGYHGQLWDAPGRPGFRTDAGGMLYHPQWLSGEYSCPPGWSPTPGPPGTTPTPPGRPPVRGSSLSIPVASALITTASPFTAAPREPCHYCGLSGHAQYECPRRFFETYSSPLPGFLPSGDPDPGAWLHGALSATARASMAAYLTLHNVPAHRKYLVTAAHIAAGT